MNKSLSTISYCAYFYVNIEEPRKNSLEIQVYFDKQKEIVNSFNLKYFRKGYL